MSMEEMIIKEFKEKKARRDFLTATALIGLLARYRDYDSDEEILKKSVKEAISVADATIKEMDKKDD